MTMKNMHRRSFLTCLTLLSASQLTFSASESESVTYPGQHKTGFIYDDVFLKHSLGPYHPESRQRLAAIAKRMQQSALLNSVIQLGPRAEVFPVIKQIHTDPHIDGIRSRYPLSYRIALQGVAAALTAVDEVCAGRLDNAFCAIRPPGHHALNTGKEEGFCFFNTIAIAARYAQSKFGLKRVLIVDWDYHHGNGTELAFYDDPSVLFFSTHDYYAYPGTGDPDREGVDEGAGYNINVHLSCGAGDSDIIGAFQERLLPAAEAFKPELILISAGFDAREGDKLGCFNISDDGFRELTQMLMELAAKYGKGRIISALEGGYTPDGLAEAVYTHVKTLSGLG